MLQRLVVAAAGCGAAGLAPTPPSAAEDCGSSHRWLAGPAPYRVAFTPRLAAGTSVTEPPVGQHFELDTAAGPRRLTHEVEVP